MVTTESVVCRDVTQLQVCSWHSQHEFLEQTVVLASFVMKCETIDDKSRFLIHRQSFHIDVQRVIRQGFQDDVCTDILYPEVFWIEDPRGFWGVETVVVHTGMTDDERMNAQIEWGMARGVFRSQRVDHELTVQFVVFGSLVDAGMSTEQLCFGDADFSFHQR